MPPDPPNSLIYSIFLALAAAGPRQSKSLEPPVFLITTLAVQINWEFVAGLPLHSKYLFIYFL